MSCGNRGGTRSPHSQMDKLVIWIPATWKFMGRVLDVQGCGIRGQRIGHKAPWAELADLYIGGANDEGRPLRLCRALADYCHALRNTV